MHSNAVKSNSAIFWHASFRRRLANIKYLFRLILHKLDSILFKEAWKVESGNPDNNSKISIYYVGSHKERHYLGKLFFGNQNKHTFLGRQLIWDAFLHYRREKHLFDIAIIHTKSRLIRDLFPVRSFRLPSWVGGTVDLHKNLDTSMSLRKGAKANLRKIQKSPFTMEISQNISGFDDFYYRMYIPFLNQRHEKYAVVESYDDLKQDFMKRKCELLFAKINSQRIAGLMVYYNGNKAVAHKIGVLEGGQRWVNLGVISFLYYKSLKYCAQNGHRHMDMGGSRPFLSDGVLRYKLNNWNMRIKDFTKDKYFILKPLNHRRATKHFLIQNPFISIKKKQLEATIFFEDSKADARFIQKLKSRYTKIGLDAVQLMQFSSVNGRNKLMRVGGDLNAGINP